MSGVSLPNTRRANVLSKLKTSNNVIYALRNGIITEGEARNRGKNFITANTLVEFSKKPVNFSKTPRQATRRRKAKRGTRRR
jgi:hypothetical protein